MGNPWEVFFTVAWLALWVLFPIGLFLSVSHVDKNTDQIIRLQRLRHYSTKAPAQVSKPKKRVFHLPQWASFRGPLRH